jgi:hypothetical protein
VLVVVRPARFRQSGVAVVGHRSNLLLGSAW